MKKFPQIPFTLSEGKEGDQTLLDYLSKSSNFDYLSEETRCLIGEIPALHKDGLQSEQKYLLRLWPRVLTDALLTLKRHDKREYNKKNPHMDTFFHAQSLGTTELKEVITAFSDFEGLLYGASPGRYRDHIVHSFRVWIIGQGLLNQNMKFELSHHEKNVPKISKGEWNCMWAITALCHDLGYPLSAVGKINKLARETFQKQGLIPEGDLRFTFTQQMLPFHDTIIKLMASKPVKLQKDRYLTHLQNKYYLKLLKSFDSLRHGIVSSVLISRGLVYFLESDYCHDTQNPLNNDDTKQFLIRREILRAIAAHTCQDIYHLNFNTLSFLLYMVDEIQCWGRPTLEELLSKPANFGDVSVEILRFETNRIDIKISTKQKKWNAEQETAVKSQISKLHRMLRLAVGTPELAKDKVLKFIISNKKESCSLILENGGITLEPVSLFEDSFSKS